MSNPKVVIIVLVVVAVLFALVLGAGAARGPDTPEGRDASTAAGLLKKLYREEKLAPAEVKGGCLQGPAFLVPTLQPCVSRFDASDKRVRTAALRLTAGGQVEIDYQPSPEDAAAVPVKLKLKGGKEMKLQVLENGGTLKLTCLSGVGPTGCLVQLN